jgi:hypothetical protein
MRRLFLAAIVAVTCGAVVLLADTFAAITGGGPGGTFISGDTWTHGIAEQVRQNFNVLQTRLLAVEAAYITASSTTTLTNKTLNVESTGNVVTVTQKAFWLGAICQNATALTDWSLPTSNPAVAACVTGTNTQKGTLDYADGGSNLSAQRMLRLPADWTSTVDVVLTWYTSATSGNVVWQVATICVADAETDDPAFNTASTVTDAAKGTTNQLNDATITGLTITGCAAGEQLHLKVFRDPAHASDTVAATAKLVGVELTYRRAM